MVNLGHVAILHVCPQLFSPPNSIQNSINVSKNSQRTSPSWISFSIFNNGIKLSMFLILGKQFYPKKNEIFTRLLGTLSFCISYSFTILTIVVTDCREILFPILL